MLRFFHSAIMFNFLPVVFFVIIIVIIIIYLTLNSINLCVVCFFVYTSQNFSFTFSKHRMWLTQRALHRIAHHLIVLRSN